MGNLVSNRIDPNVPRKKQSLLSLDFNKEISRNNFRFISKISSTGENNESIIWLAENWNDKNEKFFVKKTCKQLVEKHRRVDAIMNELKILIKERNKFIIEPLFAFQDYGSLYLVNEFVKGFTLQEVLKEHVLTEEQAKYIIVGLITIIEKLHQQKFAITDLCPKNLIIDKETGYLKLTELVNPLPIDSYYPSNMISPFNPYSAPEVLLMDKVLAESDYYSLGLILYYIMKNRSPIPDEIVHDRIAILNQNIEVVKSDLPQGWKPEAADFLVKLLIKNPELRLGRYGSFEVRNHPWLQNYSWSTKYTSSNINLSEGYFKAKQYDPITNSEPRQEKKQINDSYQFQIQFEDYYYRINEKQTQSQSDSIQEQF